MTAFYIYIYLYKLLFSQFVVVINTLSILYKRQKCKKRMLFMISSAFVIWIESFKTFSKYVMHLLPQVTNSFSICNGKHVASAVHVNIKTYEEGWK